MKGAVLSIIKKELARFFGDKRMVFTTILLPGLMIYVMYSFMGNAMTGMFSVDDDYIPTIETVNMPQSIGAIFKEANLSYSEITPDEIAGETERIEDQNLDALIVFPEDFDDAIAGYESQSGEKAPNIDIYYNSASTSSSETYSMIFSVLDSFESMLANKFDINNTEEAHDLVSDEDMTGSIFAMMLPMLLMTFMYSGSAAVAPESIAGEKERGTIATLLITPIKRSDIAIGKIIALAFIALLSGISSATGTILSLPKLMSEAGGLDINVYHTSDYMLLGVVILSTVLVFITVISIISTFAKTVKEASTMVMPLMIVSMFLGLTSMFGNGAAEEWYYYAIPVYNSVQCMTGIFSFNINPGFVGITAATNIVIAVIGVFVLTRMFNSEKIIFSK